MESKLISSCAFNRQAHDTVVDWLDKADFSDIGWLVLSAITEYYQRDTGAQEVDIELLKQQLGRTHPRMCDAVEQVLDNLDQVSAPNVLAEYVELRIQSLGRRVSHALQTQNLQEYSELSKQLTELVEHREGAIIKEDESKTFIGFDVSDIMEFNTPESLIPIYPQALNTVLDGGAPRGSHIVIFARPETGKTMFCVNLVANFLKAGRSALYCCNEDPRKSIQQRLMSNLLRMNKYELKEEDPEYLEQQLAAEGGDQLYFEDMHPGSVPHVRRMVERHRPDVVIVDQIRNLRTPRAYTKVEGLEYIAQEMRNIAKEFDCVVVSVTQAGDSADGKRDLGMGDVDFSNTGIPSTADLMIGIGVTPQLESDNQRRLSLPKNKISGTHEGLTVGVNPDYSEVL